MFKSYLYLFLVFFANAQGFGFGLGYGSSKVLMLDFVFYTENYSFHFASSTELNFPKGSEYNESLSGFGDKVIADQYNYWSIDLGFGKKIFSGFRLLGDFSIGEDRKFLSYYNMRTDNHYYIKADSKLIVGAGSYISYLYRNYDISIGYNTLRKITFIIRFRIF